MAIFKTNKGLSLDSQTGKTETIIGPSVKVEGDFKGEGDVIIAGSVHGTLTTKQNLTITESSVIKADVAALNIVVSGEITGNVLAKEKIEITKSAKIHGDIEATVMSIEAGAQIAGKCSTIQTGENEPASSSTKKEREAKLAKSTS